MENRDCAHFWTVTSECPKCLRAEVEKQKEKFRQERYARESLFVENDKLRAEGERLSGEIAFKDDAIKEHHRSYLAAFDECAELRADVVWAVRHGASASYDGDSHPAVWYEVDSSRMTRWGIPVTSVEYDGTDASMLSAVRRAREANDGLA